MAITRMRADLQLKAGSVTSSTIKDQTILTDDLAPTALGAALQLATTGDPVVISASAPPTTGQVLKATSPTSAAWSSDDAGGGASGVSGSMQFSDGVGGFLSDASNLFWDNTNKRLGVGRVPGAAEGPYPLEVAGFLSVIGDVGVGHASATVQSRGYGLLGAVVCHTANGTEAAPLATLSGENFAFFGGKGFDGANFSLTGSRAAIIYQATENWTTTAQGAQIRFRVTANGTNANTQNSVLMASATGSPRLGIGSGSPARTIHANGDIGSFGPTAGVFVTPTAGSNALIALEASTRTWLAASIDSTGEFTIVDSTGGQNVLVFEAGTPAYSIYGSSIGVGVGTTTPESKLHVVGTFKLVDGSQSAGYVLTSDASGLASWQAAGGLSFPILAPNGSLFAPTYSFTDDSGSGMTYYNGVALLYAGARKLEALGDRIDLFVPLKYATGAADGKVLTSDADGLSSWQEPGIKTVKVSLTYSDFATAASTNTINLVLLPAGAMILAAKYKVSQQFSGGTVTDGNLTIGDDVAADNVVGANVSIVNDAINDQNISYNSSMIPENTSITTQITASISVTGDTLDNLTAGAVDAWITYVVQS